MIDPWTPAHDWLPIAAAVAGAWAIASALWLARDWRSHSSDWQYCVVLVLCMLAFVGGGVTLILAGWAMTA